ncbi:hypothetical protein SAMN05421812_109304 [Asanoa hainanensis]|uniref:Uncharacterized protein n=1 Tax=Asanoa hainanensis TaxID=560556 RepID=A0A239NMA6_9ACTN|nr:hypothetical protein [Asanoa hainanensis]SNT56006.1 hypothetical protein SAMN05421812_109304 [Asanoa hainanensis]
MTARQQAPNQVTQRSQVTQRARPALFVVPAEWPTGFDPTRGLLVTLDWCSGRVVSEERVEYVGERWSPVRHPFVVSAVLFLADAGYRHGHRSRPVAPGQPAA